MSETNNYSKWTHEELLIEEKQIKKKQTISALLIGVLIGVLIYGVVKNGIGFLHIFIPFILISGIYRHSQQLKEKLTQIQTATKAKKIK